MTNAEPKTEAPSAPTPSVNPVPPSLVTKEDAGQPCACQPAAKPEQFIYALGKLDIRFPSIAIEREFQQRERQLFLSGGERSGSRGERLRAVLRVNPHLARSICYLLSVTGVPAYSIVPTGPEVLGLIIDSLVRADEPDGWDLVIGRGGPIADPAVCGGVMVQMVACDAIYSFTLSDLFKQLRERAEPALKAFEGKADFGSVARDLFLRVVLSMENTGALDTHRALNYLLVQHPGPFIAAIQRVDTAVLDNIETRLTESVGGRHVISVILTFLDRTTGVPERLFTRVDVTEEWPFIVDAPHGAASPIGLAPFVDSGIPGSGI